MPSPRLDDNLLEYTFTKEELKAAKFLTHLQLLYLHTKKAQIIKQKALRQIPDKELEYDWIREACELDGKLGMIQELLDGHAEALKEVSDPNKQDVDTLIAGTDVRASQLVHQLPQP